jgi:protein gp37
MSTTKIEWATHVWNPVTGCTKVSAGCKNCYAERLHKRMHAMMPSKYAESFSKVQCHEDVLLQPFKWKKHRRVFVNSMSDLFHEDVPDIFIKFVFSIMASLPDHEFLVLTKRPERMRKIVSEMDWVHGLYLWEKQILHNNCLGVGVKSVNGNFVPPNVWLGVSVENQETANERIPLLLQTPAAIRFLSCEPLLEFIDLELDEMDIALEPGSYGPNENILGPIHWVIAGGESGRLARPMAPNWVKFIKDQCFAANVPFFFKQWGEWLPSYQAGERSGENVNAHKTIGDRWATNSKLVGGQNMVKVGKGIAGRKLDGAEHNALPHCYVEAHINFKSAITNEVSGRADI